MSKQKYYHAVVNSKGTVEEIHGKPLIYTNKRNIGLFFKSNFEIVSIPVEDLHKLINKHRKKNPQQ